MGQTGSGPKRLGPCGQQSFHIPKYKFIWNVTALYGNNTNRAENVCEPYTSSRLTINCQLRTSSIGCVHSIKIVNPPAGNKKDWPRYQQALPGRLKQLANRPSQKFIRPAIKFRPMHTSSPNGQQSDKTQLLNPYFLN